MTTDSVVRYARTPRLNVVTVSLTVLPALAIGVLPLVVPGLPWWVVWLGPALALVLLFQLKALFGRWRLWAELHPCELVWGLNGKPRRVDLHRVAELYIDEPRKYRFVYEDGGSELVDLRVLYHAMEHLDGLLAERVTAQLVGEIVHALSTVGTYRFGPIAVFAGERARLEVRDFQVPLARNDVIWGKLLITVADSETNQVRLVPRHEIPNLHTLATTLELLRRQPLHELCEQFPAHEPRAPASA